MTKSIIQKTKTVDDVKNEIISRNQTAFMWLQGAITGGFDAVFNNKDFTPQQIFDSFGEDGAELIRLHYQAQLLLKELDEEYEILTPPYEYTINPSGSVTIGEPIPQEEEESEGK